MGTLPGRQLDYGLEPNPESQEKGEPLGESPGQQAAPPTPSLTPGLIACCLLEAPAVLPLSPT